jgi:hypothetical protein
LIWRFLPATTAMTHSTHTPHSMHALRSRVGRSKARAAPGTSRCTHSSAVAAAEICSASPMKTTELRIAGYGYARLPRDMREIGRSRLWHRPSPARQPALAAGMLSIRRHQLTLNYAPDNAGDKKQEVSFHNSRIDSLTYALARHRRRGRRVACNVICIPQPTRLPLQIPGQRVEIDVSSGENNADSFASDVDLPLLNCSKRYSC